MFRRVLAVCKRKGLRHMCISAAARRCFLHEMLGLSKSASSKHVLKYESKRTCSALRLYASLVMHEANF